MDPQGKAVQTTLQSLGFPSVQGVRVGKSIKVALDCDNNAQAELLKGSISRSDSSPATA